MNRFGRALRLELALQVRQKFLHAAVFSGFIWLAVLLPMSQALRPIAEPYILVGDISIIGFFFIAGTVFFEKQERTLGAIICTPLRFREYLAAKIAVLLGISVMVGVGVSTIANGFHYRVVPLTVGVVLGALIMLLSGFVSSLPFASISDWFLSATIPLAILSLPILGFSGVWATPLLYVIPTYGPLLLFGAAFGQVTLTGWLALYAVAYPVICIAGLYWAGKAAFGKYIVAKSGGM
jgi:fluoroquinolone transport system permease protein